MRRLRARGQRDAGAVGAAMSRSCPAPLAAGWPRGAPYDVIVLEGASEVVPDSLLAQLNDGGRLVAVIGGGPMGKATIYRRAGAHATAQPLFDAAAPLLPGFVKPPAFVF